MPEPTEPGETPEAQTQQPQAGGETPAAGDGESVEELKAKLASIREHANAKERELRTAAKERDALAEEKRKRDEAELSESDRLKRENERLAASLAAKDATIRERDTRHAVILAAQTLNVVDADAAYRLLDLGKVEYGEDGQPANVEPLLKTLLEAKPWLVKPETPAPTQHGTNGVPATPKPANGQAVTQAQTQDKQQQFDRVGLALWGKG
jgi:hypothetical protein